MSTRVIYCAIAEFPDERRGEMPAIREALERFDAALKSGGSIEEAGATLPREAQWAAMAAARLIREFEACVGEECGAQVGSNSSPLAGIGGECSVSLENRDANMFSGAVAQELAARVAAALSGLLEALGATKTIHGHID